MMKRIVLTGGGTAGHVTPHLSLIPRLKAAGYDIHYIGTERGIAIEVTPAARAWLLAQNKEVGMGARPLRRILQRFVREKLTDYLLTLEAPPAKVMVCE